MSEEEYTSIDDIPHRIYAIGDIHGCYDDLVTLLKAIAEDIASRPPTHLTTIVFLGDYVDRGPDSYSVIDLVHRLRWRPIDTLTEITGVSLETPEQQENRGLARRYGVDLILDVVTLRGNHEQMMLDAISREQDIGDLGGFRLSDYSPTGMWLSAGGLQTVRSYQQAFATEKFVLPSHHVGFLNNTEIADIYDKCGPNQDQVWVFVHGGIDPSEDPSLKNLNEYECMWIRQPYLSIDFTMPKTQDGGGFSNGEVRVVSGHTPVNDIVHGKGKCLIDTGCVFGGKLTAVMFETDKDFEIQWSSSIKSTNVNYITDFR